MGVVRQNFAKSLELFTSRRVGALDRSSPRVKGREFSSGGIYRHRNRSQTPWWLDVQSQQLLSEGEVLGIRSWRE
jgi:hypothetical protein